MGCNCGIDSTIAVRDWKLGSTERINRLRNTYWTFAPTVDLERAVSYTETYKKMEAHESIVKKAQALKDYISNRTIYIGEDELIVGSYGRHPRAVLMCPELCWSWFKTEIDTMATRPQDPYQISEEDKKTLREVVLPYWEGKAMEDYYIANLSDDVKKVAFDTGVVFGENKSQGGAGEWSSGYDTIVLKKGFKGIKAEAEEKLKELDVCDPNNFDKIKFYDAMILSCESAKIIGERHAEKLREMAKTETNEVRKKELLELADICDRVPYEPPQTYHEAIQAIWFTQILLFSEENTTSNNLGRLDRVLYPFYKKDLEEGRITEAKAQELLECLWIKMAEIVYIISEASSVYFSGYQPYHGLTCGGIEEDGTTSVNDISYMILQATMNLRMHAPSVIVRISENTPEAFMMKLSDLVAVGTGQPAIVFDKTGMKILENNGVEKRHLWDWCVSGCVEPQIPGKMSMWDEGGRYSYATAVEWALYNGLSKILGRTIGLETGNAVDFKTYEEFEAAVEKQLMHMIEMACRSCQVVERAHQLRAPKPMHSCVVHGPMESGKDIMFGGAYYTMGPGIEATGVADIADSMSAIKKLVFEEKKLTMGELISALDADFEGYEDIRQMLINDAPKYGNDDEYVDSIAKHFVELSCDYIQNFKSVNGSVYLNGVVPAIANVPHGEATWALPSGRKKGVPLADGISPYPGYDKKGPGAVVKSVSAIDHIKNGVGTLLNIKLNPDIMKTDNDKHNFIALLRSIEELGCYHVQFNVLKTETLREAQKKPEEYGDLLVRVAGYSAYFTELRRDAQESIIARTDNGSW